ncbi:MAG: serine/threonine-protein kinase [Myxococcota bacterium]|nr:serine/threonine-protein kinase [Myxococcota bacterium]
MNDVRSIAAQSPVHATLPSLGAIIADHSILEQIGVGGFGAVYRALHRRLGREVALKILKPNQEFAGDLPQRFTREINLTVRLEHPNIVRVYDCGEDQGLLWMSMEYVRGLTLSELLKQNLQLDFPRARRICMQILSGLVSAHEQLIVHRDLKPGNIMLMRSGAEDDFVKILDFGIAKALGEGENKAVQNLTETGHSSFGTPRYMAPEQIFNKQIGPWTDVYSVGLMLYEMLVGKPAIDGDTAFEVLANQVTKPVELPTKLLFSEIGPTLQKAIHKEVSERFSSAKEFYDALRLLDANASISDNISGPTPLVGMHGDEGNRTVRSTQIPSAAFLASLQQQQAAAKPKHKLGLWLLIAALSVALIGLLLFVFLRGDNTSPAADQATQEPAVPTQTADVIIDAAPIWPPPEPAQPDLEPELAAPAVITLRLESQPSEAKVMENGEFLGLTPLDLELSPESLEPPRRFVLEKDGYLSQTFEQGPVEATSISKRIELEKKRRKPKPQENSTPEDDPGLRPR